MACLDELLRSLSWLLSLVKKEEIRVGSFEFVLIDLWI